MWLIILQFILAIPSIIKTVKEIWELIKQLRDPDKKAMYETRLRDIIRKRGSDSHMSAEAHSSLDKLLADLKAEAA